MFLSNEASMLIATYGMNIVQKITGDQVTLLATICPWYSRKEVTVAESTLFLTSTKRSPSRISKG